MHLHDSIVAQSDAGIYYGRGATAVINSGIHIYRQLFVDDGAKVPNLPEASILTKFVIF